MDHLIQNPHLALAKGATPRQSTESPWILVELKLNIMTISEIKAKYNLKRLPFNWFIAEDGTQTEWLRFWDNDNRRAFLMHKDVDSMLQDNLDFDGLFPSEKEKEGEQGKFTNITIVGAARVY